VIGSTISHFRIVSELGSGGMGVVYLADDLHLNRKVALKLLAPNAPDQHAETRLRREAYAASGIDHPNVATIYEVGEWDGRTFVSMAYYEGETLRQRLGRGPLPVDEASSVIGQIALGLAAAHGAGLVHRDLKPANIIVTPAGQIKILDFGLAKTMAGAMDETALMLTQAGTIVGTPGYMSPEQIRGEVVDIRTDVWSLGVIAYELLAGRRPFEAGTLTAYAMALATETPAPIRRVRPEVPANLERVVDAALKKDPSHRTMSAAEIASLLRPAGQTASPSQLTSMRRRAAAGWIIAASLVLVGVAGWWVWSTQSERTRARTEGVSQIGDLAEHERFVEAFDQLARIRGDLDHNVALRLDELVGYPITVASTPDGATVSYAEFGATPVWHRLGVTPVKGVAVPRGLLWWRIEKAGFETFNDFTQSSAAMTATLDRAGSRTFGLVRAIAPRLPVEVEVGGISMPPVHLQTFWIGRTEVTNGEFQAFVDANGYANRSFWKREFKMNGAPLSWNDGMARLRDATGRPGPAAWELGRHPAGQEQMPVAGVSWYEAAAFAEYAGASLPTLYHFRHVAGNALMFRTVVPFAIFSKPAPVAVGTSNARHRSGTFDLGGNVKEWSLTESDGGRQYALGGGWDEPPYVVAAADARDPFERSPNLGFRLARYAPDDPSPKALAGPIVVGRDVFIPPAVTQEVFDAYARAFTYDHTPLKDVVLEARDESPLDWVRETVTIPVTSGSDRLKFHVLLPKHGHPPFQPVVFVPGGDAYTTTRSSTEAVERPLAGFLVRSGHALVVPILSGTYERVIPDLKLTSSQWRDVVVATSKELGRVLDYLATRPDMASDKIGYLGYSRGAAHGPVYLSVEPRFKAAVFWLAGFYRTRVPPDVNITHYAPRMRQPVLVIDGRYDSIFPEQESQIPFFQALGTAAADKRRVVYDTGHNLFVNPRVKDTIDWFEKYLGIVR
jgi:hypothetical protein